MKLTIEANQHQLQLSGDLTVEQVERHWPLPVQWFSQPRLQLDLSQLERVDSVGLAWLLQIDVQQRRHAEPVQWLNCPTTVHRLLALYNLSVEQHCLVTTKQK